MVLRVILCRSIRMSQQQVISSVSHWLLGCGLFVCFFFFQAEDGIRDLTVTGVQTCALPISVSAAHRGRLRGSVLDGEGHLYGGAATAPQAQPAAEPLEGQVAAGSADRERDRKSVV